MLGSVNGLCAVRNALCSLSKPTAVHERQDVLDQVSSSRRNVALSDAWASRPQEWGRDGPADGGRANYSISEAKTAVPLVSRTRMSGEVVVKRTRRCGATGSQIPARDTGNAEQDPPREK